MRCRPARTVPVPDAVPRAAAVIAPVPVAVPLAAPVSAHSALSAPLTASASAAAAPWAVAGFRERYAEAHDIIKEYDEQLACQVVHERLKLDAMNCVAYRQWLWEERLSEITEPLLKNPRQHTPVMRGSVHLPPPFPSQHRVAAVHYALQQSKLWDSINEFLLIKVADEKGYFSLRAQVITEVQDELYAVHGLHRSTNVIKNQ